VGAGIVGDGPTRGGVRAEFLDGGHRRWWTGVGGGVAATENPDGTVTVGGSVSVGVDWRPSDRVLVRSRLSYEKDDVVWQDVMGYDDGVRFRVGVEVEY
jgi:hypothetical protein